MSHWCDFCQTEHSSMSCYHPARERIAELEEENERLNKLQEISRYENMPGKLRALRSRAERAEAALRENVPHLGEMIRMPNIEHVADAHNKAVKQLRAILDELSRDSADKSA